MNLHIQLVEIKFDFFVSILISFALKCLQCLASSPVYLWRSYRQVEFVLFAKSENLGHMLLSMNKLNFGHCITLVSD